MLTWLKLRFRLESPFLEVGRIPFFPVSISATPLEFVLFPFEFLVKKKEMNSAFPRKLSIFSHGCDYITQISGNNVCFILNNLIFIGLNASDPECQFVLFLQRGQTITSFKRLLQHQSNQCEKFGPIFHFYSQTKGTVRLHVYINRIRD